MKENLKILILLMLCIIPSCKTGPEINPTVSRLVADPLEVEAHLFTFMSREGSTLRDLCDALNSELETDIYFTTCPEDPFPGGFVEFTSVQLVDLLTSQGYTLRRFGSMVVIEKIPLKISTLDNVQAGNFEEWQKARALLPTFQNSAALYIVETSQGADLGASSDLVISSADFFRQLSIEIKNIIISGALSGSDKVKKIVFPLSDVPYVYDCTTDKTKEERTVSDAGTSTVSGYKNFQAGFKLRVKADPLGAGYIVTSEVESSAWTGDLEKSTNSAQSSVYVLPGQVALIADLEDFEDSRGLNVLGVDLLRKKNRKKIYLSLDK